MHVSSIEFKNYRNLESKKIELKPGLNILVGPNGSGKTNFLELIHIFSHGKLFRQGELKNIIQEGHVHSHITTIIEKNTNFSTMRMGISKTEKRITLNGKPTSSFKMKSYFPTVLFSPESLSVIKSSDSERRDLIDELVLFCFPQKVDTFSNYLRVLKQKQKLLKDNWQNKISSQQLYSLLKSLNTKFLPLSAEVTHLRLQALEKIQPHWKESIKNIFSVESDVDISVDYLISENRANAWSYEEIFNAMYNRLKELENFELTSGKVLVGPHKHDVSFNLNGKNARFFGSQGQQRSLIIAFKMAQVKLHCLTHGYHPVLLLDDVLSELDEIKRERLLYYLNTIKSQVILTTTEIEESWKKTLSDFYCFQLKEGKFLQDMNYQIGAVSV